MNESIFYNTLKDWSKRHITPEEKSLYIKEYMRKHNISQRELARQLDIPHSTIHDWISMRQTIKIENIKIQGVYNYANKLLFLLSRENFNYDDRTKNRLRELRETITRLLDENK